MWGQLKNVYSVSHSESLNKMNEATPREFPAGNCLGTCLLSSAHRLITGGGEGTFLIRVTAQQHRVKTAPTQSIFVGGVHDPEKMSEVLCFLFLPPLMLLSQRRPRLECLPPVFMASNNSTTCWKRNCAATTQQYKHVRSMVPGWLSR